MMFFGCVWEGVEWFLVFEELCGEGVGGVSGLWVGKWGGFGVYWFVLGW